MFSNQKEPLLSYTLFEAESRNYPQWLMNRNTFVTLPNPEYCKTMVSSYEYVLTSTSNGPV